MFTSATLKLTFWYLLILMTISIIFSVVIYNMATHEIGQSLEQFQTGILSLPGFELQPRHGFREVRIQQADLAAATLFIELIYVNVIILLAGGLGSYVLARRSLKQIEQVHDAQTRFVSDASHELRTPLAIMKAELEVTLRDSDVSKSELKSVLKSSLEEVDRLSKLANTLLSMSRLDSRPIEKAEISLVEIVNSAADIFDKSRSRIKINHPKEKIIIQAQETGVVELVTILIDNAIKYSPAKSPITIDIHKLDSGVKFSVSNTGQGISEKDLPHVFERFYRGDSARTGGMTGGYGLGLSLAKQIVDAHGGTISVASKPGKTTTLTVKFSTPFRQRF